MPPTSPTPERNSGLSRRAALAAAAAAVAAPAVALGAAGAASAAPAPAGAPGARPGGVQPAQEPDFGPNVTVFDPSMPREQIQQQLNAAFAVQEENQFGTERFAFLFRPGDYQDLDVNVGYYTHIAGLGRNVEDVHITGWVRVEADWFDGNATHNFWRTAENLTVTPWDGYNRWAVSQAAPIRRVHIRGEMPLWNGYDGWASGGYMADCKVDRVVSGSQQQWFTRNSSLGEWAGSVWNMVFLGVNGAPPDHFPNPSHTVVPQTPVIREKPFLYIDGAGGYSVFVPAPTWNHSGTSWENSPTPGHSLPLSSFHIVREGDSAASINAALGEGKHLLVTPGIYEIDQTIEINRPETIVLGLGLATLIPQNGVTAIRVADVDGVRVAGLLIDAGPVESASLMEVGNPNGGARHASNPIYLQDVFARIGGAGAGKAVDSLIVYSHDTVIDHTWLWRGDHGEGIGWDVNPAARGLVVHGDHVTAYGLFAEHYQEHQVMWHGSNGRTYFFQCEMPYDPPDQASYMNGAERGYPGYWVDPGVTSHQAVGLGVYCLFLEDAGIVSERAISAPEVSGVSFQRMVIVSLGGWGTINRVINDTGGPAGPNDNNGIYYLTSHP